MNSARLSHLLGLATLLLVAVPDLSSSESIPWQATIQAELAQVRRLHFADIYNVNSNAVHVLVTAPMATLFDSVPEAEMSAYLQSLSDSGQHPEAKDLQSYLKRCLQLLRERCQHSAPRKIYVTPPDGRTEIVLVVDYPMPRTELATASARSAGKNLTSPAPGLQAVGKWDGESWTTIVVRVVEENSEDPVSGAQVRILSGRDYMLYQAALAAGGENETWDGQVARLSKKATADDTGQATADVRLEAGGDILANGSKTAFRFLRGIVIVEATDHQRCAAKLEDLLPKGYQDDGSSPIRVTVRLKKTISP